MFSVLQNQDLAYLKLILKFNWTILRIQSWLAELHNFLCRISPELYTPLKCFDTENLANGTVLRTDPSSMATMKRRKN
jgi:hypothetical protein